MELILITKGVGAVTRLRKESTTGTSAIELTFFHSSLHRILKQHQCYLRISLQLWNITTAKELEPGFFA
jgi:hypothetical protein